MPDDLREQRGDLLAGLVDRRRDEVRGALASELDFGGRAVVLYNLHLESRGFGYTRYAQLAEVIGVLLSR